MPRLDHVGDVKTRRRIIGLPMTVYKRFWDDNDNRPQSGPRMRAPREFIATA